MLACHSCSSFEITQSEEAPDRDWLVKNNCGYKMRGPPVKSRKGLKSGIGGSLRGIGRGMSNRIPYKPKVASLSRKASPK